MHHSSLSYPRPLAGLALAVLLSLSACGGGGGGSGAPAVTAPVAVTPPAPARLHPVLIAGAENTASSGSFADGAGAAAHFGHAAGLAADKAGNVFVADADNCAIRKVTPQGIVTTLAGQPAACDPRATPTPADGVGSQARFYNLAGLAIDAQDKLYVIDTASVRTVTPQGMVSTLAGVLERTTPIVDGSGAAARFYAPYLIAAAPDGRLLVADLGHAPVSDGHTGACIDMEDRDFLREITPQGAVTTIPGSASNCAAPNPSLLSGMKLPRFDKAGNLFYSKGANFVRWPAGGAPALIADENGKPIVIGDNEVVSAIVPDDFGNLYYLTADFTIMKIARDGKRTMVVSNRADAPPEINPDMSLFGMSQMAYLGNHDFALMVLGRVVRITLN